MKYHIVIRRLYDIEIEAENRNEALSKIAGKMEPREIVLLIEKMEEVESGAEKEE